MHAIVVEDDADQRELVRQVMQYAGWTVDLAEDGIAALSHIRHDRPDVIILDLRMPAPDGVEFLKLLRATEVGRRIPVVVTTGGSVDENIRELASAVLFKPFEPARLTEAVGAAVTRYRKPAPI